MKVFDSDILVEHLRGNPSATDLIRVHGRDGAISVLTRFELLAGMRSAERRAVRSLLDALPNLAVSESIATKAGDFARQYRRSHAHISPIGYLIAATVEIHGAELLTMNVRHFPMIPDISPPI